MGQSTPQNRSRSFAPGSCGPVDPTYIRTAEATGGIPFFFQRTEVAQATRYMIANTGSNHVTVLWAKGVLQGSSRDFVVPVDSTLTSVIFALSTDNREAKLEVFDPSDSEVAGGPKVESTEFTCGRYMIVKSPAPGSYRVHLSGSGHYWLSVGGQSDIFLHAVEFVERGGRPGHEGMFAIHGQPIIDKPATLQAIVAGAAKGVSFDLMTPEGQPLRSVSLKSIHTDHDDQEFAGSIAVPAEPFRVVASGTDQSGHPFQRVHEALVSPSTVSIALLYADDLNSGKSSSLTFRVTNHGSTEEFQLVAVCANGWPTHADRPDITLTRNESATVTITISVPGGTSAYTGADLILTATSDRDPNIANSFVVALSVDPPQP
ncbi:MAG: hypothetical protein ACXVZV_04290 [Terriglobales bacterium]